MADINLLKCRKNEELVVPIATIRFDRLTKQFKIKVDCLINSAFWLNIEFGKDELFQAKAESEQ